MPTQSIVLSVELEWTRALKTGGVEAVDHFLADISAGS